MAETDLMRLVGLPIGLGLFGFIEPCSIGSTLIFIKTLEGRNAPSQLAQVGAFMTMRALFMGALGFTAVALGTAFLGFQKAASIITQAALDRLAGLSRRIPFWTGVVLIVLGLWSVWFG